MKHTSTILIVDDEPSARDVLEALLLPEGYNLAFANSGPEALEKAAEITPDVILLDVVMPDMDGFEVCRRLRADPFLAGVPVIMVTGLDDRDSRLQSIEAGADDFVSKPFDGVELQARVRTITQLNRYRQLLLEQAKFKWVIEHTSDGYLIVNDNDEVLYANPKARLYLGLPPHESKPISETFMELAGKQYKCEPGETWATWQEPSASDLQSPRYLVRPESPTANVFWLQVDILDLPSVLNEGRVIRLRDVTAQMALQRDMRGFHAVISHKLRTPLEGILGSLKLLVDFDIELSSDETAEFLTMAFQSAQRLQSEIQDILAYLDAPRLAESSERFNLSQLQSMVVETSSDLGIKSVTVSCPEDLRESFVLLSHRAMELVLREILENSKKFHPEQTPVVEVWVSHANSKEVRFQIRDNGLTLSPEHLGRIWTPYYQGEKYFTGQMPGMGLGLAMVATLVWGVGGTCRAYNRQDGPGVVVELVLPLAKDK